MNPVFISRYRVLEEIGRGGMGVVYKAEDPRLERLVAVKTLPPKLLRNAEALRRFLREAKVAAKLDHPNIVPIYDVGEDNGVYFMVMEYLEGTTLRDWIETREVIDIPRALHLFRQIAKAMDYAHQRKVIHRDVKPDNVMVIHNDVAKVMDFGIAVMDDRHSVTQPGAVLGTIAYISPEQAKGQPADTRSDIYSLGIVLFEFLTGELPFPAKTPSEMLGHHLATVPPLPSSLNQTVPQKLDPIVLKTLEKNPDLRYQSVSSLLEDLDKVLANGKVEPKTDAGASRKELLDSVESFLSLNPEPPSESELDKTKLLEGLKALISQPSPSAEPTGTDEEKAAASRESFSKYRVAVERIQKDLLALNQQFPSNPKDVLDVKKRGIEDGVALYDQGKYQESISFFGSLIKNDPRLLEAYFYLGLSYFQLKKFREALSHFRKGVELNPSHGRMWQGVGDSASELGNDLEAAQAYQQAIQFLPSALLWKRLGNLETKFGHFTNARRAFAKAIELDPEDEEAKKSLVQVLIELSEFQEALDLVKKQLKKTPDNVEWLRLLGKLYEYTNRNNQALQAYEKALSINPADADVLSQLGDLHDRQNQTDLAVSHFSKAAEAEAQNPEVYTKLATLHLKRNEDDQALTCLEKASSLAPNDPSIHRELGKIFFKKKDLEKAMIQFEWTIALDPSDPDAHGRLGQIYYKKNQAELSIREFKTAIGLDPYNPEFHENLGMVYYIEDEFDQAIEELKRAITLDPGNIDYHKALGVIYETQGKLDLARKAYQKAAEAVPRDYLSQGLLGRVYLEQGLTHLAIFQFQKSLTLEPRSYLMESLLGKAYLKSGQLNDAEAAFRKALSKAPELNTPRGKQIRGKTYFYLGQSLLESSQPQEAVATLKQSIELLPKFAKAYHLLGKAEYLLGDREKARRDLEKATRLSLEDSEVFYDLAEMLAAAEDYPAAIQALRKAIKADPERAGYYGLLGDFYFHIGDFQQAQQAYQQALQLEKSKKGLYHGKIGNLFMERKDYTEAATQYKAAIALSPENWQTHQDLAKAFKAMGKIEDAVSELERAKAKNSSSDVLSLIEEEIDRLKKGK